MIEISAIPVSRFAPCVHRLSSQGERTLSWPLWSGMNQWRSVWNHDTCANPSEDLTCVMMQLKCSPNDLFSTVNRFWSKRKSRNMSRLLKRRKQRNKRNHEYFDQSWQKQTCAFVRQYCIRNLIHKNSHCFSSHCWRDTQGLHIFILVWHKHLIWLISRLLFGWIR